MAFLVGLMAATMAGNYFTPCFGGRIIERAALDPQAGPTATTQLTATYGIAEGLGIGFVSTPDDTKIVSTGLFSLFASAGPSQEAFATPTSAPFLDTAPSGGYIGALQIAPDSRTLFYKKGPLNSVSPAPLMYTTSRSPEQ